MALRAFLDASALFAAALSPYGAAHQLLRLAEANFYRLYTSEVVVEEAERNLERSAPEGVPVFRALLAALPIMVRPAPRRGQVERARSVAGVRAEDAPLLAVAVERKCVLLVTLDPRLLDVNVSELAPQLTVATPGKILHMSD